MCIGAATSTGVAPPIVKPGKSAGVFQPIVQPGYGAGVFQPFHYPAFHGYLGNFPGAPPLYYYPGSTLSPRMAPTTVFPVPKSIASVIQKSLTKQFEKYGGEVHVYESTSEVPVSTYGVGKATTKQEADPICNCPLTHTEAVQKSAFHTPEPQNNVVSYVVDKSTNKVGSASTEVLFPFKSVTNVHSTNQIVESEIPVKVYESVRPVIKYRVANVETESPVPEPSKSANNFVVYKSPVIHIEVVQKSDFHAPDPQNNVASYIVGKSTSKGLFPVKSVKQEIVVPIFQSTNQDEYEIPVKVYEAARPVIKYRVANAETESPVTIAPVPEPTKSVNNIVVLKSVPQYAVPAKSLHRPLVANVHPVENFPQGVVVMVSQQNPKSSSSACKQDLISHLIVVDPLKLGWILEDNRLVPKLSDSCLKPNYYCRLSFYQYDTRLLSLLSIVRHCRIS
ncbi:hypothetical protein GQR58_026451 [Nymphon striatum]|nr:hypothetical protein GQR58_026451 [Nymphon striatum]